MVVSTSAFAAFGEDDFLSLVQNLQHHFFSLRISYDRTKWNIDVDIGTIGTVLVLSSPGVAMTGNYVPRVFQVQKRPVLGVAANDNVASTAAITTIWTALGCHSIPHEMRRTRSTSAGTAADFYVINKIFT